ncbi:MAG: alpha/beta fold hydrolase [Acidimicrobiia bacterium]|nr:alpha/beta fold hydrolase [Acidimicrobiia bacterium]MYG58125.1 alpha/beta fold hydrolase [Acidimicrobiia bacterium]MYJ32970.1 alpha/beta fold hydrolase [Acidimicrobiia bacterium]
MSEEVEAGTIGSTAGESDVLDPNWVGEQIIDTLDPVYFARTLVNAGMKAASNPVGVGTALLKAAAGAMKVGAATMAKAAKTADPEAPAPIRPQPKDQRWSSTAWQDNPYFFGLQQTYLLSRNLADDLIDAANLDDAEDRKAKFAASFAFDALAPTNMLLTNPDALAKAAATGGASVVKGAANMLHDLRHNDGWPSKVDDSGFEPGLNMALTPGKVVYRSDLIEVMQYEPQTEQTYEIPMLFCPPWINKYYIMDLAPQKSLIEWAVQHGHTCFTISYRNPDGSMRDTSFEDYLRQGPLDALRVVQEITGQKKVNTVNVCLGGTLSAIAMAHGAAIGDQPIHTATFLNTLTDFSDPGVLGAFTDEPTVAGLERKMADQGYLEASEMARTFDAIRANDLIFQYVVNNWLLGEDPPAFDLLAWNNDSTRMPARMHSSYLRRCYLHNEFANDAFEVEGTALCPADVKQDAYVLSAIDDHIVPWTAAYRTATLLGGRNRFVLSTSGHIAGIVNPPSPKARHWTNDQIPESPEEWLEGAEQHQQTWWEDWATWIGERAGKKVDAPQRLGSKAYAPMEDAPGLYVKMRSGDAASD